MAYEEIVSVPSSTTSGKVPTTNGSGGYTWSDPSSGVQIVVSSTQPTIPAGSFWYQVT